MQGQYRLCVSQPEGTTAKSNETAFARYRVETYSPFKSYHILQERFCGRPTALAQPGSLAEHQHPGLYAQLAQAVLSQ